MNKIFKTIHIIFQVLIFIFCIVLIVLGFVQGFSSKFAGFMEYSMLAPATIILFVISEFIWLFIDYYKHRKPLLAVDPEVNYSLIHHVKQVTVPTIKYRLSNIFKK